MRHRPACVLVLLLAGCGGAAPEPRRESELDLAAKRFRVAAGLNVELFASEPDLANPVAFTIDERGRFYVVETHRIGTSVFDIRNYMGWLDDDLAARTVEDRLAMYAKHLGKDAAKLAVESERVRFLADEDGNGRADRAETFAEDFKTQADGLASGVLVRKGDVYFANIPNLWLLRDVDGDGHADVRKVLHTGYGVHMNYIGHDLHGLILGPDGKLYFSIGDRGLHVQTGNRTVSNPDSGAVLRCNPDGSELELYATGLRNPQELAFDQHGNLWTWDNNSDWHDMARWVYVVEGGDSGWRIGYQFLEGRGPWESEKVWEAGAEVPYRLPPVANIDHGPSGIAFYPGTGLPERYDNHFLLCNFPGGVNSWAVKEKGASFEVVDRQEFLWGLWATDVDFGPDGAVYVSDWGEGWSKKGVGRIWRVYDPTRRYDPQVLSVRHLLAEGMSKRAEPELAALLGHKDQRVRREAQFELVSRGATATLVGAVQNGPGLARLHAIWGLGQVGQTGLLVPLLQAPDSEVRAQAARMLGERRVAAAAEAAAKLLKDPSLRVRFFAAMALGRMRARAAGPAVVEMIRANADADAYLRHGGVMALAGIGDAELLDRAAKDSSRSVRLAALLAMRRLESPAVAAFLQDKDPALVVEAARAIYDVPIPGAMVALSRLLREPGCPEAALSRAIHASFRIDDPEGAGALSALALRRGAPEALRAEALRRLVEWEQPSGRDPVVGLWRPIPSREGREARRWIQPELPNLIREPSDMVRTEAIRLWALHRLDDVLPVVEEVFRDRAVSPGVRLEALRALAPISEGRYILEALGDPEETLRREAIRRIPAANMENPAALLEPLAAGSHPLPIRQAAVAALAEIPTAGAKEAVQRLLAKEIPAGLRLDLEEAAERKGLEVVKGAPGEVMLEGGDPKRGSAVFSRASSGCMKCHKLKDGGGTVGPALTDVGARLSRMKIAESILDPNAEIAKGFEQVMVQTASGDVKVGRVEREDAHVLVLMDDQGRVDSIPKGKIQARKEAKSAMPEDFRKTLTRREVRDLVEFLAGYRAVPPTVEPGAVVVDNENPAAFRTEGNWRTQTAGGDYGRNTHWSFPDASGRGKATWTATLEPGTYRVYVWFGIDPLGEHATTAPFTVEYEGGSRTVRVDQTKDTCSWRLLGTFPRPARVVLSNDADRPVYGDAVKFVRD